LFVVDLDKQLRKYLNIKTKNLLVLEYKVVKTSVTESSETTIVNIVDMSYNVSLTVVSVASKLADDNISAKMFPWKNKSIITIQYTDVCLKMFYIVKEIREKSLTLNMIL
jgi:hypothetical protein